MAETAFYDHRAFLEGVPPTISCPEPDTLECTGPNGTEAVVSVTVEDPDDTVLVIAWYLDGSLAELDTVVAPALPVTETVTFRPVLDLGMRDIEAWVSDGFFADSCSTTVLVVDTTPPTLTVSLNRDVLWPPNHKMSDIFANVVVNDACCESPAFVLVKIESNEDDDGKGDGNKIDDIQGDDLDTPDTEFQLRSERSGKGDGRVYNIIYVAWDCSGYSTYDTTYVRVPHDQSGLALTSHGFVEDGTTFDASSEEFAIILPSTDILDASRVNAQDVYVGNSSGAIRPTKIELTDANGDRRRDLIAYFSRSEALALIVPPIQDGAIAIDRRGISWDVTLGMHYRSASGIDYLVEDVFAVGPRVIPSDPDPDVDKDCESVAPSTKPDTYYTALRAIYPNPFNPRTTISFSLAEQVEVLVLVYDVQGRLVRVLLDRTLPAGLHVVDWDGTDTYGNGMSTGIYFVRLEAGSYNVTRKAALLK
ncbi:MAG: T9SS type A sorting domain-containing protein [Planctomycetota bacterium]